VLQVSTALVLSAGIAKGIVQASSILLTLLAGYTPIASYPAVGFKLLVLN